MKYKLKQFPSTIFDAKEDAIKFAMGLKYTPKQIKENLIKVT